MICLSFDTDWMSEADMARFLETYPFPGRGTFFMHQPYTILHQTPHELAPHPFPVGPGEWKESISRLMDSLGIAPTGVRTHSCIHSHVLELALYDLGFRYTSNSSRLFEAGVRPARLAWGLWELPVYYMDNLDLTTAAYWPDLDQHRPLDPAVVAQAIDGEGLYVFDIHPLHVCLNTPNLDYYLQRADRLKAGESPFDLRYAGRGVGTFFAELTAMLANRQVESVAMIDALGQLT